MKNAGVNAVVKMSCLAVVLLLGACGAPGTEPSPPTEPVDNPPTVADLQVNLDERSGDPVAQDGSFAYYVSVRNNGDGEAKGVKLTVKTPFAVTEVPTECSFSDLTLKCDLGILEKGFTKGVLVSGKATKGGVASISASVSADTNDPDPSNDSTSESFRVFVPTPSDADLQVSLDERFGDPVAQGETVTYYADVRNNGNNSAKDIKLTVTIPFSVSKVPQGCNSSGDTLTCSFGELAKGKNKGVIVSGTAAEEGVFAVSANASTSTNDPDLSNNSITESFEVFVPTSASADLQVTLDERSGNRVAQDDLLNYYANVRNNGKDAAEGIKLVVEVPFQVNEVAQECSLSGDTLTCSYDELKVGESKGILVSGQASEAGKFSVSARVSAKVTDPDPSNNTTTENFEVFVPVSPADLQGQIANWSAGETTLSTVFYGASGTPTKVASGTVGADGGLEVYLGESVAADFLTKLPACTGLSQSNPDARQNVFSSLQVTRGQTAVGRVALASGQAVLTEGLRKVGDYYVQQTYADAANTVTGSCALGGVVDAVFRYDLKLNQGWNTVTFKLVKKDGDAQTLELSSGTPQGAAWFFAP